MRRSAAFVATLGPASMPRADYCSDQGASTKAASTRCAFMANRRCSASMRSRPALWRARYFPSRGRGPSRRPAALMLLVRRRSVASPAQVARNARDYDSVIASRSPRSAPAGDDGDRSGVARGFPILIRKAVSGLAGEEVLGIGGAGELLAHQVGQEQQRTAWPVVRGDVLGLPGGVPGHEDGTANRFAADLSCVVLEPAVLAVGAGEVELLGLVQRADGAHDCPNALRA